MNKDREMKPEILEHLLTLIMCSDPWPVMDSEGKEVEANSEAVIAWADEESKRHGFKDWIDAYHELPKQIRNK